MPRPRSGSGNKPKEVKSGTEKKPETGIEKKPETGTDGPAPPASSPEAKRKKAEDDKKYACPPGTCMKNPGRLAVFMAKYYQKVKYATAAFLLAVLILSLIIYAAVCTRNQKEEKRRAKEDFEQRVRSVYFGEDLF